MHLITQHEGKELVYEVRKDVVTIGRDVTCDISLNATSVSRYHVQLRRDGERLVVKDLGSRNGTRVNGARITETPLQDGDTIQIGALRIVYRVELPAEPKGFTPLPSPPVPAPAPAADPSLAPAPTPQDLEFAPEKYRQSLPAGGPQLVERDGRYYLQDPATGREVEIKPIAGGGDPVQAAMRRLQGMTPGARRVLVLVAAVVFCGVCLAVALRKPDPVAPDPGTQMLLDPREYDGRIDEAVRSLSAAVAALPGDAESSRAALAQVGAAMQDLHRLNPPRGTAPLVEQWALFWAGIEPDYSNFPWEQGLDRLMIDIFQKLEAHRYATPAVKHEVGQQREWVTRQLADKEQVLAILRLIESDREEDWKRALQDLERLPSETQFARTVRGRAPELRVRIFDLHARAARAAFERQAWQGVRPEVDLARPWGDPDAVAPLDELAAQAAEEARCQAILARAREELQRGMAQPGFQPQRVIDIAGEVPEGSRYRAEAQGLVEQARGYLFAREVQDLFNQGPDGARRALERLSSSGQNPGGIRQTIESTLAAWEAGQTHLAAYAYDDAVAAWDQILSRLDRNAYGMNWFRQEAETLRRQWADPRRQARTFFDLGMAAREEASGTGNFADAVRWFLRAQERDPDHVLGSDELAEMERQAVDIVARALNLAPTRAARDAEIRRALTMLPDGSPRHREYQQLLR